AYIQKRWPAMGCCGSRAYSQSDGCREKIAAPFVAILLKVTKAIEFMKVFAAPFVKSIIADKFA
ncbi:MAG: hypothetical protein V7727_20440, partial [Sneathiella sp.]